MRKLKAPDLFTGIRLLKTIGLREQAREIARKADTADDIWANGFDFVWGIFDAATESNGEEAVYRFLAGPFEMTPEEVKSLDVADLMSMLRQLAADNNLIDFFKRAAALTR